MTSLKELLLGTELLGFVMPKAVDGEIRRASGAKIGKGPTAPARNRLQS